MQLLRGRARVHTSAQIFLQLLDVCQESHHDTTHDLWLSLEHANYSGLLFSANTSG